MIGILLALQVNEWNNRRLDRQAELTYYENIKHQITRDKGRIADEIEFNSQYIEQFKYAMAILESGNRSQKDTLGRIAKNLKNYSDFNQQGNIYQTLLNSGQSKVLKNQNILQELHDLEENYMHINRMENIHYDAIMTYVIPETAWTVDFSSGRIIKEERIFDFVFLNLIRSLVEIMEEKDQIYKKALTRIDTTITMIDKELLNIQELRTELLSIKAEKDIIFRRSKGSMLHDFYNSCERIFKKIAIEMNGGYEDTEKWHKNLLYKMTIPIEGLRPSVISQELAADLDEFLAFRHLFRNIYGFELKGDRIDYLAEKFEQVSGKFEEEIRAFLSSLRKELS